MKQKTEWYHEYYDEIIIMECSECGHQEETDEEILECPECGNDDYMMIETALEGMRCEICESYFDGEVESMSYKGDTSKGAFENICTSCYNDIEDQEYRDEEEEEELKEAMQFESKMQENPEKLLKTFTEMSSTYYEKKKFPISRYYPEHEESAHNSRWIEPARWATVYVSEDEYNDTPFSKRYSVEVERIYIPFEQFVDSYSTKARKFIDIWENINDLNVFADGLFALKQYKYILLLNLKKEFKTFDEKIEMHVYQETLKAVEEVIVEAEKKLEKIRKSFAGKIDAKKIEQARNEELKKQERINQLEAELKRLKGE